jgi:hypothetical protein
MADIGTISARIRMQADKLDDEAAKFQMGRLNAPVFLNGVPKCGTHLIRNIARMFVGIEQQHRREFVQLPMLHRNMDAFNPAEPKVSWGHMVFSDESAVALKNVRHVLLVRDPYDWVLARARFYLSDEFDGPMNHIKKGGASADAVLNLMIFGAMGKAPTLQDVFTFNAVAWLGLGVQVVKYEDIVAHLKQLDSDAAKIFFADLLAKMGIDPVPDDWRERIRIGADRIHSSTASEKLHGDIDVPKILPEMQKRLVDQAAPGLRSVLGYA